MRYMLLICTDKSAEPQPGSDEYDRMMAGYWAFRAEAGAAGVHRAGDPLQPVAAARTLRMRDGSALISDGPFAETKEQLGGYFIIECASLAEAQAWAAKIPGARYGAIEVRAISEMG
jgi:hypothetical protein